MYNNTTRLESEIWLSPSLGTKFWKWGRPLTKERAKNDAILAVAIVAKLKNASESRQSKVLGSGVRTLSSPGTYTLTSLGH
jgi:hypothetical protein